MAVLKQLCDQKQFNKQKKNKCPFLKRILAIKKKSGNSMAMWP